MFNSVLKFLTFISGKNSAVKQIPIYSLDQTYSNKGFQQTLEMIFGDEGITTSIIRENEVLSFGAKSLYLKIAILTNQEDCYNFLDKIYALIQQKKPGHYWELLTCIKNINDHCNNTPHLYTKDNYKYDEINCLKIFFANLDKENVLSVHSVAPAMKYLIKRQIEVIGAKVRIYSNTEEYKEQQISLAQELDSTTADPSWRLKLLDITHDQVRNTDDTVQTNWHNRDYKLAEVNNTHNQTCPNQNCPELFTLLRNANKAYDAEFDKQQKQMMAADHRRYVEELAAVEKIKKAEIKPKPM